MSTGGAIPAGALIELRRWPVEGAAGLCGVSRATVYRALAGRLRPKGLPAPS